MARKVDDATVARVKALHLNGLSFIPESKRFYPSGLLAAPVLGFVGTDNYGLAGLESFYEKSLRGRSGEMRVERDPQGNEIPGGASILEPAKRGKDIVLTIDQSIQANTEHVLTQQVETAGAKGGMAIVADVLTGDILAMATVDGATDEHPAGPAPASEQNKPATVVYEPGSTNKVITMAGAIEDGLVTPDTVIDGVGSEVVVGGTTYSDVDTHPSTMSVAEILEHSSNVGTIRIASMLGPERFDHYLHAFGFGQQTALGFPGEANYPAAAARQLQRHEHGLDADRKRHRGQRDPDARRVHDDRERRHGACAAVGGSDGRRATVIVTMSRSSRRTA